MPKIRLKPKSPEFDQPEKKVRSKGCDMPGCRAHGEHRAPRDRSLKENYWFCFEHVKEYNAAWNFFSGMSDQEVEQQILNSLYGDRPTWRYDVDGAAADALRRVAWQTYNNTEKEPPRYNGRKNEIPAQTPEGEALAIMELEPPVTLKEIKERYKALAKKHHPDLNPGDSRAEDLLKSINMAYTILKLSYAKFEKLEARS
jgi:hypothetical protein